MGHHKRKGPKSTRAGCLMCKGWKDQRVKDTGSARTPAQVRADESFEVSLEEVEEARTADDQD